jgi:hypothetical protein
MLELSSCYYKDNDYKAVQIKLNRCLLYMSYETCIAFFKRDEQILYVLDTKISNTTSRHRKSITDRYVMNQIVNLKTEEFKERLAEVI